MDFSFRSHDFHGIFLFSFFSVFSLVGFFLVHAYIHSMDFHNKGETGASILTGGKVDNEKLRSPIIVVDGIGLS